MKPFSRQTVDSLQHTTGDVSGPAIHTPDAPQRWLSDDTLLAPVATPCVEIGALAHGSKRKVVRARLHLAAGLAQRLIRFAPNQDNARYAFLHTPV